MKLGFPLCGKCTHFTALFLAGIKFTCFLFSLTFLTPFLRGEISRLGGKRKFDSVKTKRLLHTRTHVWVRVSPFGMRSTESAIIKNEMLNLHMNEPSPLIIPEASFLPISGLHIFTDIRLPWLVTMGRALSHASSSCDALFGGGQLIYHSIPLRPFAASSVLPREGSWFDWTRGFEWRVVGWEALVIISLTYGGARVTHPLVCVIITHA